MPGLFNTLTSFLGLPSASDRVSRAEQSRAEREHKEAVAMIEGQKEYLERKYRESLVELDYWRWNARGPYDGGTLDPWAGGGYLPGGTPQDRLAGGSYPILRTEDDLRRMRAFSRLLIDTNLYAQGFMEHVRNFVLGTGFKVEIVKAGQKTGATSMGAEEEEVDPAVAACQQVWDEFCSLNGWGCGDESAVHLERDGDASPPPNREREAYQRLMRDGEVFLRIFRGGTRTNGIPSVRFMAPERVTCPPGESQQGPWSWGIRTDKDDVETRKEYYEAPMRMDEKGEYVKAAEVVYTKVNTDGEVKRGIPDFYTVESSLTNAKTTLHAMERVTGLQASIAYLRQHAPGTTSTQVTNLLNSTTVQSPHAFPLDGRPDTHRYLTLHQAGAIIDLSNQLVMAPPPSNPGTPGHIMVQQQTLRAIGQRWGCPEYFSGDSSNANYASTLVAGGPFERATLARQSDFKVFEQGLAVAVLLAAVKSGRLSAEDVATVAVKVTAPEVAITDKYQDTQRRALLVEKLGVSRQTLQRELGYDPALELANTKAWQEEFAPEVGPAGDDPEGGEDGNPTRMTDTPPDDDPPPPTSEGFDPSQPRDDHGRWAAEVAAAKGKLNALPKASKKDAHFRGNYGDEVSLKDVGFAGKGEGFGVNAILNDEEFKALAVEMTLDPKDVKFTQSSVSKELLAKKIDDPTIMGSKHKDAVTVVKHKGEYHLSGGNHRAVAEVLRTGKFTAFVVETDGKRPGGVYKFKRPTLAEGFDPSQPRDKDGKFAEKPGGGSDGDDGKGGSNSGSGAKATPPNPHADIKPGETVGAVTRWKDGFLYADTEHPDFDPKHFDPDGEPWHPDERRELYDADDDPHKDSNPYGDIYAGGGDDDVPELGDISGDLADVIADHPATDVSDYFSGVGKPGDDLDQKPDERAGMIRAAVEKATADQQALADEYHAKLTAAGVPAEAAGEVKAVYATHAAAVAGAAERWRGKDAEAQAGFRAAEKVANELDTAKGYAIPRPDLPPRPTAPTKPTPVDARTQFAHDNYRAKVRAYRSDLADYREKVSDWKDKRAELIEKARAERRAELEEINDRRVRTYRAAEAARREATAARKDYLKRSGRMAERLSAVAMQVYQRAGGVAESVGVTIVRPQPDAGRVLAEIVMGSIGRQTEMLATMASRPIEVTVRQEPAVVNVTTPAVTVNVPETVINVAPPEVTVNVPPQEVSVTAMIPPRVTETAIVRDEGGKIASVTQVEKDAGGAE